MKTLTLALAIASVSVQGLCSDIDGTILQIQQAIQSGDLDSASRLIAASLPHHPDGGLYNLRGIVHARRDELAEAHRDFAEAVRLSPGLVPAWQNLARACRIESEQQPSSESCAISASEKVLQFKSDDAEARSSLALLYLQKGQFAKSLGELDKLPPGDASEITNGLVRCADLAVLNREPDATALAAQLANNPELNARMLVSVEKAFTAPQSAPVFISLLQALDARQAADLAALRQLAIAYERVGRTADARKTLERVAILDPRNPAHLLELARIAEDQKDHEGAIGYLGHARDLDPKNAQIHFLFAKVASELDLPVEARASLDRALAIEPNNPVYNFAMGTVILTTRDAASAATYFKKFLAVRPDDPKGHYALGVAEFTSGDYASAKADIGRVQKDPKLGGAAAYFLGRMAFLEDDLEAAAGDLRRSIALMPDYAESHTELARVYLRQERSEDARTELQRALVIDPHSFQANSQLLILFKRTHDPKAEEQSRLVKQLDENRSKRAELMLRTIELRP